MRLFSAFILLFLSVFTSGIAGAQDLTISSCDQGGINQALQSVYQSGGGTVYLEAGTYPVTGQVQIGSNTHLTGSPDAIIKVSSSSSQFFTDGTGIIGLISSNSHDIEIDSIQLDGNLKAFPQSWANSGSGIHNAGRAIDFRGYEGAFLQNIKIHNLKIYDFFSDGIHIAFAVNVNCYSNFVSNCQHSGIYYINVLESMLDNNQIAGITSDCARLDNCVKIYVFQNIFYSFMGDSGGAYEKGQNGLQIGDQGFSHGGGSAKPNHSSDIEVYNNIFADCGKRSIWLDAAGLDPTTNAYIHDNRFVDVSSVSTSGISFTNPPTVEQSEHVFSSIFDILNEQFTSSGNLDQSWIVPAIQWENKGLYTSAWVDVPAYNNTIQIGNETYIKGSSIECADVMCGASSNAPYA
jgi:hypothetical protein